MEDCICDCTQWKTFYATARKRDFSLKKSIHKRTSAPTPFRFQSIFLDLVQKFKTFLFARELIISVTRDQMHI